MPPKRSRLAKIDADIKLAELQVFKEIELAKVTYQNNSVQSTVGTVGDKLAQIEAEKETRQSFYNAVRLGLRVSNDLVPLTTPISPARAIFFKE